jgi:hypothetical protein
MSAENDNDSWYPRSDAGGTLPHFVAPGLADGLLPPGTQSTDLPPHFVAPGPTRRVNVNFSDQAYRTLEELAARSGKSMSEVLREAIALKAWFDRERANGNRILVERPHGQVREVISV